MTTLALGAFRHNPLTLFAAGAVAVLVFHQGALAILHGLGIVGQPFPYAASWPFGVPAIWSYVFWGGVWGIVFGAVEPRFPRGAMYWTAAFLFGAIFPTFVAWFVVAPLKGAPLAGGWVLAGLWIGPLINGAWGLGTALLLRWRGWRSRVNRCAGWARASRATVVPAVSARLWAPRRRAGAVQRRHPPEGRRPRRPLRGCMSICWSRRRQG